MLGAHRAAHLDGELQDRVVDGLVIGVGTEDVDVQVPIAHVPVDEGSCVGVRAVDGVPHCEVEFANATDRDGHVELVRHAGGVHGLGVALA